MADDDTIACSLKEALEMSYKLRDHASIADEWHVAAVRLARRLNQVYGELQDLATEWRRESRLIGHCPECNVTLDDCATQLQEKLGELRHAEQPPHDHHRAGNKGP